MFAYDTISTTGRKQAFGLSFLQPAILVIAGFLLLDYGTLQEPSPSRPAAREILALAAPAPEHDSETMWELVSSEPAVLTRLLPSEVQQLFDEPQTVRREAGSSMWQYRANACLLNLYFSSAADGQVTQYRISPRRNGKAVSEADCLRAIRDEYTIPKRKKKFA